MGYVTLIFPIGLILRVCQGDEQGQRKLARESDGYRLGHACHAAQGNPVPVEN
jgi:hypothetical protein